MRFISPLVHGVLDYGTVVLMFLLPALFGWSDAVRSLLFTAGIALLGLSLLTIYPLGVAKMIQFPTHLAADVALGIALLISPFFIKVIYAGGMTALMLFGLFEIGAGLLTQTEPSSRPVASG